MEFPRSSPDPSKSLSTSSPLQREHYLSFKQPHPFVEQGSFCCSLETLKEWHHLCASMAMWPVLLLIDHTGSWEIWGFASSPGRRPQRPLALRFRTTHWFYYVIFPPVLPLNPVGVGKERQSPFLRTHQHIHSLCIPSDSPVRLQNVNLEKKQVSPRLSFLKSLFYIGLGLLKLNSQKRNPFFCSVIPSKAE